MIDLGGRVDYLAQTRNGWLFSKIFMFLNDFDWGIEVNSLFVSVRL